MKNTLLLAFVLFLSTACMVQAGERRSFIFETSTDTYLVDTMTAASGAPRPAVVILSGSRGFGSPAYDTLGQVLNDAGIDAYFLPVLNATDLETIAGAKNAAERIAHYAMRMPDWTADVRSFISSLDQQPVHAGNVGLLGISLGAQIASASALGNGNLDALVLVSGGLPNDYAGPAGPFPPLYLIWGSEDRTFRPAIGMALRDAAKNIGGQADIRLFDGGAHDFFLRADSAMAREAHQAAAAFLRQHLLSPEP